MNPSQQRRRTDHVRAALAEFFRNLALLLFGAPLVEPLLTNGGGFDPIKAIAGGGLGVAVLAVSLYIESQRKD